MTGKERVLNAIKCKEVDRVPWVPFVGVHGGKLIGKTAEEFLKSDELVVQGIEESIKRYKPDGIPVMFDLQMEAELLGCDLVWAKDNPPAVVSHPLENGEGLEKLSIPKADDGRIKIALEATRIMKQRHPDIALYGLITGPFTLALHLMGTSIFMKMFDDPAYLNKVMTFCKDVGNAMSSYYIEAGCDVIAIVDPMTSQIGPDQFKQFVSPYVTDVFDHIRKEGALGSFFVCGHAQKNIEVMCDCKPDNLSVDENISLEYLRDIALPQGISFGGNLQLTITLLLGTPEDVIKNTSECLTIGGDKGFLLAPGCDLPYDTPVENLEVVSTVIDDPYGKLVKETLSTQKGVEDVLDMSEYGQADKIIVDIITLDSEACAPCQYMVESVKDIAPEFEGIVEWREHKIKNKEGISFMTSLMVRNIPTICIDGQIAFVSQIPPKEELIAIVQKRINEKLRSKLKFSRSTLYLFGGGCDSCDAVMDNIQTAVKELGSTVEIKHVTDEAEMLKHGITQTPSVMLEKRQIKSRGSVVSKDIIKEWLKEL